LNWGYQNGRAHHKAIPPRCAARGQVSAAHTAINSSFLYGVLAVLCLCMPGKKERLFVAWSVFFLAVAFSGRALVGLGASQVCDVAHSIVLSI